MDFLHVWFCIQFRACVAFLHRHTKKPDLQEVCTNAPLNSRPPVPEFPHRRLKVFPVPVSLQHRVFIHNNEVGSSLRAFDLFGEKDSEPVAPTFVNGLLDGFGSFFRALSHRGFPGEVSSSCFHPSSREQPRKSMSFSRLSFFHRFIELLAETLLPVFLMLFLCQGPTDRKAPNSLAQSVVYLALLLEAHHLQGHTRLLCASSLSSLLCFRSLDTCARLLITHSSSSFGLLATRSLTALATLLLKKSLIASAVFSLSTRWSNFA